MTWRRGHEAHLLPDEVRGGVGDVTWHPGLPAEYRDEIVTGDARVLAEMIPDESVDLIVTDPPYPREYLHLYRWLGEVGARVLRPGRYLFAYGAAEHLPEQIAALHESGLTYFWTDVLLHNGGFPRVWYKRLVSGYKPVYVLTRGAPGRLAWRSTFHVCRRDKRFHTWGQGEGYPFKVIEMLTDPGNVVLDPFCGGGTVPAVCKMLGRNHVAFEIDPDVAERARRRVRDAQPPLLVPEPEQLGTGL